MPSPGDHPNPGIEPRSPALQADSLPAEPQGKPKNIGMGSLSLLQRIFPTQESNRGLLCCRWILYQQSYQGSLGQCCKQHHHWLALVCCCVYSAVVTQELPCSSGSKESACDAGDTGSVPGSGRSLGKGMATHSSILAWIIPRTEEPRGCSPWGRRESDTAKQLSLSLCLRKHSQVGLFCYYVELFLVFFILKKDYSFL